MDRLLTGVGDGCDSCLVPRYLWHDEDTIDEGFPMNRTLESIRETWESLKKNKKGDVVKFTGDYEERQGICRAPVTLRETLSFSMTHKVGNVIQFQIPALVWSKLLLASRSFIITIKIFPTMYFISLHSNLK